MKTKILKTLLGFIVIMILLSVLGLFGYLDATYYIDATVTSIHDGVITVTDSRGEQWEICDTEMIIQKNETVELLMHTNHTYSKIRDDKILKVRRK